MSARCTFEQNARGKNTEYSQRDRRAFRPKERTGGPINSANSANCVIPKRVVDRLDAVGLWVVRKTSKQK